MLAGLLYRPFLGRYWFTAQKLRGASSAMLDNRTEILLFEPLNGLNRIPYRSAETDKTRAVVLPITPALKSSFANLPSGSQIGLGKVDHKLFPCVRPIAERYTKIASSQNGTAGPKPTINSIDCQV